MSDSRQDNAIQTVFQNASGQRLEFSLVHSGGNTVSGATPIIGYVSPDDTTLVSLGTPVITELSIVQASGHYLLTPTLTMVDQLGTVTVYASGVGTVLGQSGTKQSELTLFNFEVVENPIEPQIIDNFIAGLPQKRTVTSLVGKGTRSTFFRGWNSSGLLH